MKLYCPTCIKYNKISTSFAGPHIKAECTVCGRYIKFLNSSERLMVEGEEDNFDSDKIEADRYWKQREIEYYKDPY